MQIQTLVDRTVKKWIYMKHKKVSYRTVPTNSFKFVEQHEKRTQTFELLQTLNMSYNTINTTSGSCISSAYFPLQVAERFSPELRAVFIFRIAVNALSCPFVILLNILVITAVKTNRRLRTKSNVSLACLLKLWFFQASSFQLLKLENLLRWSFFTLIYNRSSNIWIISYILQIISLLTGDMNSINWPRSQCVAS